MLRNRKKEVNDVIYKIFKKNNQFEVFTFNENENSYLEFIKMFTSKGYSQFIVTTDIMINLMQIVRSNKGIVKDINIQEELYDSDTLNVFKELPSKMREDENFNIKQFMQDYDVENSIDIINIDIKFKGKYFSIRSNGIIFTDEQEDNEDIQLIKRLFLGTFNEKN
uniref:Uncharacterized protein n=2 Tax=Staphylococcus epidermidis TaxID=1282 RepID=A0A894TPE5_STAEP|nr:hypothetical protein [Staphylococcus epidermidis]